MSELRAGDKVIVRDMEERGGKLFVGIVRVDGVGAYVYATPYAQLSLQPEHDGILWCRGDDLNSESAQALESAYALRS